MDEIIVSINCITYNHENYIADAIESFLMQKTNFKYEILIHDDASSDRTAEIIREYEKKYPDIIKPIYQRENQYSKGVRGIGTRFNETRSKGKYIAVCEGDDYWTDSHKLQKQVNFMESNPEYSMCFHAAEFVNVDKKATGTIARIYNEDKIVSMEDIIRKSSPGYIPTASRVYRKELAANIPQWVFDCCVGDMPMSLLLASRGKFFYMDEVMSAYRINVPGSWTNRTIEGKNRVSGNIKVIRNGIETLKAFNEYTEYKYDNEVQKAIEEKEINILLLERNIKEIVKGRYKIYYEKMNLTRKAKFLLSYYIPRTYSSLAKFKNLIEKLGC